MVATCPLRSGLAELVAYFATAADGGAAVIDSEPSESVQWVEASGTAREATLPVVLFLRTHNAMVLR